MHDAGARWHHAEVLERALGKLEELVAFGIAVELEGHIQLERVGGPIVIDLHRVVDHQIAGNDRIDPGGIAAHLGHRVAHRGEVDDARHAGEVLEDYAGRHERDFALRRRRRPRGECSNMRFGDEAVAQVAKGVLQQHPDRERQPVQSGEPGSFEGLDGVDGDVAVADSDGGLGADRIGVAHLDLVPG